MCSPLALIQRCHHLLVSADLLSFVSAEFDFGKIARDTTSRSVSHPFLSSFSYSTLYTARRFSLRGTHERAPVGILERSQATAWRNDIGDSGRAISRDERVAMALAQSHENLAAAAVQFEESQARSNQLLGGLRGWLDRFTDTARPEDINPIAAMLPDPGVEGEVVALMTDCQVYWSACSCFVD